MCQVAILACDYYIILQPPTNGHPRGHPRGVGGNGGRLTGALASCLGFKEVFLRRIFIFLCSLVFNPSPPPLGPFTWKTQKIAPTLGLIRKNANAHSKECLFCVYPPASEASRGVY